MINIRLQRRGRKNDPSFRVVVVDSKKKPKTGNYLEMVGSYDPRVDRIEIKGDRVLHWLGHGAQASDTVHNLLVSQKIIDAKKKNVLPKKTAPVKDVPAQAEVAQAETPVEPAPTAVAVEEAPAETSAEESAPQEDLSAAKEDNSVAETTPTE